MRIRHKIFVGYMALVAVSVVLVVIFLITLSNIDQSYDNLLSRDQKILLQANNLRSSVQQEVIAARAYEELGDASLASEFEGAVMDQQRAIRDLTPLLTEKADIQALHDIQIAISD